MSESQTKPRKRTTVPASSSPSTEVQIARVSLKDKFQRIENVFLIFWLIVGMSIAIFTPPGVGNDEEEHIARAAQVAEGQVLPKKVELSEIDQSLLVIPESDKDMEFYGGETDKALYNLLVLRIPSVHQAEIADMNFAFPWWSDYRYSIDGKVGQGEKVTWAFSNTSVNSLVCYVPYSLGYALASMVETSPVMCVILMRIFGVVAYGLLVWFAIRKVPICKRCLLLIAILPNSIAIGTVVSADMMTNACTFLFLTYVLRFLVSYEKTKTSDYVWLGLSLCCLALLKMPYIAFGLLLILIFVANKMWTDKQATAKIATIGVVALILFFMWTGCTKGIVPTAIWGIPGINTSEQLSFILQHPLTACKSLIVELCDTDLGLFKMTAYALRPIPAWLTIFALIIFMFKDVQNCPLMHNRLSISICFVALSSLLSILIIVAVYLTFAPVGAISYDGVQSRYFVPVLFPISASIVMLFAQKRTREAIAESQGSIPSSLLKPNKPHVTKTTVAFLFAYAFFAFYAYSVWL